MHMEHYDWNSRIERYKTQIRELTDTATNSKVEEYLRHREFQGLSQAQLYKDARSIRNLLRFRDKDIDEYEAGDIKDFMLKLKREGKRSAKIYWYSLKQFFEYHDNNGLFDTPPKFEKKRKLPEELLTREEVSKIIEGTKNARDRAFFTVLYESGARIGEMLSMRIKHVQFDDDGTVIVIDGKTGMRRVRLVESTPALAQWLNLHPNRDDNDSPVWISYQNEEEAITYHGMRRQMKKLVDKVGIDKRVHFHLFRHSRATELANHLTEQQMKMYFGWTQGSDQAAQYVHLSGREIDKAILNLHKDVREPKEEQYVQCPRCANKCHKTNKYCSQCGGEIERIED
mgnify:CR=1 FL=1